MFHDTKAYVLPRGRTHCFPKASQRISSMSENKFEPFVVPESTSCETRRGAGDAKHLPPTSVGMHGHT